ncbi:sporulation kinase E [bacterium BMS3Bbin04]|nr:sporulation kinase E [bacterium BMS3Bbin04]
MDTLAKSSNINPLIAEEDGPPAILVIDDEENVRVLLQRALEFGGYKVFAAENGQEGIDLLRKGSGIHVILTDVMMPVMDGLEVLGEAQKIDPDVEVIVLTGLGTQESAIEALKKGAYDYLQKPMNMEELFLTVQKAMERHRLTRENQAYQKNLEAIVEKRTAQLTETKTFLQSVLDSSWDYAIIAANLRGNISLFNEGAVRMLGYSQDEINGELTKTLFPPGKKNGSGPFGVDSSKLMPEQVHQCEGIFNSKSGVLIVVSMSIATLTDKSGKVIGVLCIAKDISEQKKLEREIKKHTENLEQLVEERTLELSSRNVELEKTLKHLNEAQEQLVSSEKMASIGQLAAGVAHEINNPIGFVRSNLSTMTKYTQKITGVLEAMKEKLSNDEEIEQMWKKQKISFILEDLDELLSESYDGTNRVATIVKDLKNVSNIDRSQIMDSDLEQALDSTLNIVWNEIKYKAEVEKEYAGIPSVVCNPQQVNQVFLNILVNASHAIEDPPGKIIVRTVKYSDNEVAVEIQDDGMGMDEETRSKIFDAFYTTKEIGKGTGLGLSISYRIIREHGGSIEVESELGVGTTFRIILPVGK